jgi:RNA-directed DNA polymerase
MNVEQSMCASPGGTEHWNQINWSECNRYVRRLQARIVKATREERWGKVKALQRLLTHSFSGKVLAVKRVTENKGKRTPGVDGAVWQTPGSKHKAMQTLQRRGYQPLPLRRVYIPKANGKLRPLGIPAMKDRAMQALYLLALEPVAETRGDGHSYGFRPGRCTADAIGQCHAVLKQKASAPWVLEGDIRGCFDNISHEWLLRNIPMDRVVLERWLKAGYMENRNLFPTEAGTPQGGIISPTLANLTLDGLGVLLQKTFPRGRVKGKDTNPKVHLIRYADDFIITGATREVLVNEVIPLVQQFLRERGLELSTEKTRITPLTEGFDFLGQHLRKYGDKLLVQPSKKNTHQFLEKVRTLTKQHRGARQENLIRMLNPVIRGWAYYHRHISATRVFNKTRKEIWPCLWRWAKRRHPQKSPYWIAPKYWHPFGNRKVFAADRGQRDKNGKVVWIKLVEPTDIKIRRHIKIRSAANPFDPQWDRYFEERALIRWYGENPFQPKGNPL